MSNESNKKTVLIYGGDGQLGQVIVKKFMSISSTQWEVICADFRKSEIAFHSIQLKGVVEEDVAHVKKTLGDKKLDALICVAGGWAGGSIEQTEMFAGVDRMHKQCVESSVAAAHLASLTLKESGLLVLTGAEAALKATPTMIGYGMAKVAVHHLIRTIASDKLHVIGILPRCLDTPQNRAGMPDADFSSWTPMPELASKLVVWSSSPKEKAPTTGALVSVVTENGQTSYKEEKAFA
mmetsp:Transcript_15321/g.22935  ORF Transcript_15321/g.22935 Transcript_15321/m.22935 type:complete len:237 (+) Transcript_15321:31-741(+)